MSSATPAGRTVVFTVTLPADLVRSDIARLCQEVATAGEGIIVDVSAVTDPSVVVVEALAGLRLTARRHGRCLRVHGAGPRLRELAALLGLDAVLTGTERGTGGGR